MHFQMEGLLTRWLGDALTRVRDPHVGISEHTHVCNLPMIYMPEERTTEMPWSYILSCVVAILHRDFNPVPRFTLTNLRPPQFRPLHA